VSGLLDWLFGPQSMITAGFGYIIPAALFVGVYAVVLYWKDHR